MHDWLFRCSCYLPFKSVTEKLGPRKDASGNDLVRVGHCCLPGNLHGDRAASQADGDVSGGAATFLPLTSSKSSALKLLNDAIVDNTCVHSTTSKNGPGRGTPGKGEGTRMHRAHPVYLVPTQQP